MCNSDLSNFPNKINSNTGNLANNSNIKNSVFGNNNNITIVENTKTKLYTTGAT